MTAVGAKTGMLTSAQLLAVKAVAQGASYRSGAEQLGIGPEAFRSRLYAASLAMDVTSKSANLVYVCCQHGLLELPEVIPSPPSVGLEDDDVQVLCLIALGYGYDLAARHLRTHRTVVEHRLRRVYRVLQTTNQPHAVYRGVATGNVPLNLRRLRTGGT